MLFLTALSSPHRSPVRLSARPRGRPPSRGPRPPCPWGNRSPVTRPFPFLPFLCQGGTGRCGEASTSLMPTPPCLAVLRRQGVGSTWLSAHRPHKGVCGQTNDVSCHRAKLGGRELRGVRGWGWGGGCAPERGPVESPDHRQWLNNRCRRRPGEGGGGVHHCSLSLSSFHFCESSHSMVRPDFTSNGKNTSIHFVPKQARGREGRDEVWKE